MTDTYVCKRLGKSRGMVMDELEKLGIGTQVHYIPLFLQPYYRKKQLCKFEKKYFEKIF